MSRGLSGTVRVLKQGMEDGPLATNRAGGIAAGPVARLQRLLQDLGYGGRVDGIYGPKTVQMVVKFQSLNGLPVNGEVDGPTKAALNAALTGAVVDKRASVPSDEFGEVATEAMRETLAAERQRIAETKEFFS